MNGGGAMPRRFVRPEEAREIYQHELPLFHGRVEKKILARRLRLAVEGRESLSAGELRRLVLRAKELGLDVPERLRISPGRRSPRSA